MADTTTNRARRRGRGGTARDGRGRGRGAQSSRPRPRTDDIDSAVHQPNRADDDQAQVHRRNAHNSRGLGVPVRKFSNARGNAAGLGRGKITVSPRDQLEEFLENGYEAVTASAESRQAFINHLATEDGLARIRQLIDADFSMTYSVLKPMFDPHCILFLRLISHNEVINCLVLEKSVGTIYNVVYGHDGNRGVGFFSKIMDCLLHIITDVESAKGATKDVLLKEEALLLTTKAFLNTLSLNQGAAVKKEFAAITEQLHQCYSVEDINCGQASSNIRAVHDNVLKIDDFLSTGSSLLTFKSAKSRTKVTSRQQQQPEWRLPEPDSDPPGELSELGSRHDNDHALISNIRILPTISEILNDQRSEYLPTRCDSTSPSKHHETGILRLLDSQFRLLREDTSGLLRDALRLILDNWETFCDNPDWRVKRNLLRRYSGTPVRLYTNAEVQHIKSDAIRGPQIAVEFDQVRAAKTPNPGKRKQWWRESRALREGGPLIALVNGAEDDISATFFLVSSKEICCASNSEQNNGHTVTHSIRDLASDDSRAMVTLRLADPACKDDLSNLIRLTSNGRSASPSKPYLLVEFPAIAYNLFEGVLRCLQTLHKNPSVVPFTNWLAPRFHHNALGYDLATNHAYRRIIIPPPAYLRDVTIDLQCISRSTVHNPNATPRPTFSLAYDPHMLAEHLSRDTTLDSGQAAAMVSALRHEVALIQGPPGTGKSYVGIQIARSLVANRERLGIGPILCVCYTNHALDQFLNELLNFGVTNILRIGSRSQFPRLEALSLETYNERKAIPRLPGSGKHIAQCRTELEMLNAEIQRVCSEANESNALVVKRFLEKRFPAQAQAIFYDLPKFLDTDTDSPVDDVLETWVTGDAPGVLTGDNIERTIDELLAVNIWTLTKSERSRLYHYWLASAFTELSHRFHVLMHRHSERKRLHTSLFNQSHHVFINKFDIVGITTTGLANNSDLLRGLNAQVLICEEAGEVLEAHVLNVLLPSVQHAIFIGDHLQLRPRISSLKLSMEYYRAGPKYDLDQSLFERLANSHLEDGSPFPIAQLDHQRRMHPTIAALVRETLYPLLRDHPNTTMYPQIHGMRRRLFWLDHRNYEDVGDPEEPMQSKTNLWEAKMVTALVRHLCRQGKYKPGEIAVLTPYMGQLRILRDMLGQMMELIISERDLEGLDALDVKVQENEIPAQRRRQGRHQQQQTVGTGTLLDELRIASVDNFQGEEATVVIVSLVRSNKFQNCGFLKTPNRINVLLSRAKHGMYIIGDANTSSPVPMWEEVIQLLEQDNNIGPKLELHCSRHPANKILVSSPDDFAIHAPEGGCAEKCRLRLSCGHSCTVKCHSSALHKAVKCMQMCTRARDCGHVCWKKCSDPCGGCPEKVFNVQLPCGHTIKEVECRNMGNLASIKCEQLVVRQMPECGHQIRVRCHERRAALSCSHTCECLLPCGHTCRKPCWRCRQTRDHGACQIPCGRPYTTCSHTCDQPCHPSTPCTPCYRKCEGHCKHSRCPKTCSEPCAPCAEKCGWTCIHRQDSCSLPCAVPCNIIPCNQRCENTLPCGHQCPSICGESCPDRKFCQSCCAPDILERTVDLTLLETYGQVDIDKDPLIFLPCGHFYTISTLDGLMELGQHYVTDAQTGEIVSPKVSTRIMASETTPKGCPECRVPPRNINRYNRIVKRALLDEATRRFVAYANSTYAGLMDKIHTREIQLEDEKRAFLLDWTHAAGEVKPIQQVLNALTAYQAEGIRLLKTINSFTKSVEKQEQPFGRVNNFIRAAAARQRNANPKAFEFDESVIQTGFQFRAKCLTLRLNWAIVWNHHSICSNTSIDSRVSSLLRDLVASRVKPLPNTCQSIINGSREARFPQQEAEARIYYALFSTLALRNSNALRQSISPATTTSVYEQAMGSLQEVEKLISQHPGTLAYLKDDVEKAKIFVNGDTFYSFVTTEEKKEVYRAMAEQFSGTGHWYYCENNHPFTVGECGLPMEEARCPQCGAPIGGHDHTPFQGVRRADDMEAEFGGD